MTHILRKDQKENEKNILMRVLINIGSRRVGRFEKSKEQFKRIKGIKRTKLKKWAVYIRIAIVTISWV